MSSNNELKTFAIHFMVGGVAGSFVKSFTAPLDRVKLILQTQDVAAQFGEGKRKPYTGIIDCFKRIPKEQGLSSLWRGNTINIARYFPTQALNFSCNTLYKDRLSKRFGPSSVTHFVSGALAGITTTTLLYPVEFCQTRITADVGSGDFIDREFRGLYDCISKITMVDGFHALYKGYLVAVTGVGIYRSFYFGMYGYWKEIWGKRNTEVSLIRELLIAQGITLASGIISYPFDTIGRSMMMEVGKPINQRKFVSVRNAVDSVYRRSGISGFYKGTTANYLRSISGSIMLVLYDQSIRYINDHY
ncbi:hypothetical protein RI129_010204 [Pyrocoelia pectoralis]|uniref:ADP/ATP translocase n=1 Tax=Pyrocoelia pectoralis TaxID=417401 RepID=A0AAN7ZFK6_9COLE